MIVNIEFFDENPIENVVTSLNYKIDKTIFFGYGRVMEERKKGVERFLKKVCGVKEVLFCRVEELDLPGIMEAIEREVQAEVVRGNQVFFDLTGGESLTLVALGLLSQDMNAPMHIFDIKRDEMREFGYEDVPSLSETAEYCPITLNLDSFISLYGGTVNYRMQKEFKQVWSEEQTRDVKEMWKLSRKYSQRWVHYSAFLRKCEPDYQLAVVLEESLFKAEAGKNRRLGGIREFNQFLKECESLGFLKNLFSSGGSWHFAFKSQEIQSYFWDGGSILEMYAFLLTSQREGVTDCRVGVHIDWDGVLHQAAGEDVLNEIDIMSVNHNLPTFISCKIGNVDQMSLYELETVASRFGGKYARKVLIVAKELSSGHMRRAKEMDIEVINIGSF